MRVGRDSVQTSRDGDSPAPFIEGELWVEVAIALLFSHCRSICDATQMDRLAPD